MSVIVTGAAGHLGRLVAEQLLERLPPEEVVLVTRRPEALRALRARGADVRYGDFNEPSSLRDAFAGGRRMLLISTDATGRRVRQHRAAIDAAAAAGVDHVAFTSIVNPVGRNPLGPNAWEQGRTEEMLHRSGLEWTVLRFASFAELWLPHAATAVRNGQMITNNGAGRIVTVSRRDCAEAAAITLTTDGHTGRTYDITGPQALSAREMAELYADLSGQPVRLVQLSDTMLTWVLVAIGTPPPTAYGIMAYGRAARRGYFDVVDPVFERLTGRRPVTLREVLVAHRADLLGTGMTSPEAAPGMMLRGIPGGLEGEHRSRTPRRPSVGRKSPASAAGLRVVPLEPADPATDPEHGDAPPTQARLASGF